MPYTDDCNAAGRILEAAVCSQALWPRWRRLWLAAAVRRALAPLASWGQPPPPALQLQS
jgi:hypothetical protein